MAVTWLRPLHINKGKSVSQTITERTDYAENPDKTRKGELVTGYECSPRTVDAEFLLAKQQYAEINGRDQGDKNILAYHIRQSFKPGEITPEFANKLGYDLALRFTKGKHAFIVATHVDKKHIHNHIVFDSVNLDCNQKFMNYWNSSRAVRRLSDQICLENMLSVIQEPKPRKGHYGTWLGDQKTESWRSKLQSVINKILNDKPADFETFLKLLEDAGIEVKRGKHISLKMTGQKSFIRLRSLSAEYSKEAIRESIRVKYQNPKKINLLIDIQNSIKAQNSPAYERWSKVHNLKQAAQTLLFLQDNDITEYDMLSDKAQQAKDNFNNISERIKVADTRMKEITQLQKHIGSYGKTKDTYTAYRKTGYSKKFFTDHEDEIIRHKAAKKYFDSLELQKLPTIKSLQSEYAMLSSEKGKLYSEYRQARKFMQDVLNARQNVESLLNIDSSVHESKRNQLL